MDAGSWLVIAGLCISGAMSPGPSLAVVLKNTVAGGRSRGIATGLGHGLGVGIYALGAVVGFSALVAASPILEKSLTWLGAGFLIYLGVAALRRPKVVEEAEERPGNGFAEGFLTAFLNPKIALFFLALLGAFIPEESGVITRIEVAALAMGIDTAWYVLAAVSFAGLGIAGWLAARQRHVDVVTGVGFILVGLLVLFY